MNCNPAGRALGITVFGAWLVCSSSCGEPVEPDPPGPNELRLELGGDHPTVRDRLDARPAPPRSALAANGPVGDPPGNPQANLAPEANPDPVSPAPETDPSSGRRATLGQGQTLYGLAKEHLGDGSRWREILILNGLREDQLASLPAGAVLRLPEN